jgi:uncharacterized protein (DUF1501 family)
VPRSAAPIHRREVLRLGLTGLTSLGLPGLFALRAGAAISVPHERTAIILVFLHGGASHLETYDPKPLAPAEYRGPFAAIDTKVAGIRLSELLPKHAAVADRFTILRSMVHTGFCHGIGQQQMFTGQEVRQFSPKSQYPEFLAITNYLRGRRERTLPNYVGVHPIPYLGAAYLGSAYDAFAIHGDPNSPQFAIPNLGTAEPGQVRRMDARLDLRRQMDRLRRDIDRSAAMGAIDSYEALAWNMIASASADRAFDLSREDARTRDRYGRNTWGQQCLLARRLVEHGVDLVTVTLAGPLCGRVQNWDDHAVNHHIFNAMRARSPFFDQAVSALVDDIYQRGLDRRVLLVVTGEFGRTPRISYAADSASGARQPGRDHWPAATSMLLAGGGMRTGQVIGATDRRGEQVVERRVGPLDFLATMYRHLGIDPMGIAFNDFAGRPIPVLNGGTVIPELVSQA